MHHPPAERFPGPRVHGHVRPPDGRQHAQRVERRLRERGVAVHGADAEEVQGGVVRSEEDCECVLGG